MAKRALRIRVEIVGSPEGAVESRPGRIMIVPPQVTFDDFGLAVDRAVGRWDFEDFRLFRTGGEGGSDASRPLQVSVECRISSTTTSVVADGSAR